MLCCGRSDHIDRMFVVLCLSFLLTERVCDYAIHIGIHHTCAAFHSNACGFLIFTKLLLIQFFSLCALECTISVDLSSISQTFHTQREGENVLVSVRRLFGTEKNMLLFGVGVFSNRWCLQNTHCPLMREKRRASSLSQRTTTTQSWVLAFSVVLKNPVQPAVLCCGIRLG